MNTHIGVIKMTDGKTTNNLVEINCRDGRLLMLADRTGSMTWLDHYDDHQIDIVCEMRDANQEDTRNMLSLIDPNVFMDMLTCLLIDTSKSMGMDLFSIMYMCTKMASVGIASASQDSRKYAYMGMMAEAQAMRDSETKMSARKINNNINRVFGSNQMMNNPTTSGFGRSG